jgi:hypothetical protein
MTQNVNFLATVSKKYLFTHLLVCADCGGYMSGHTHRRGWRRYICTTYKEAGNTACFANSIAEDTIKAKVIETLEAEYLSPAKLDQLRKRMQARLQGLRKSGEDKRIKKQIGELSAHIAQGNRNLALLPPDRIAGVVATIREWETQRDRLREELRRLEEGQEHLDQVIKLAESHLWKLRESLLSGDPDRLRAVFREVLSARGTLLQPPEEEQADLEHLHKGAHRLEAWFRSFPVGNFRWLNSTQLSLGWGSMVGMPM